ncbi:terminase small subunit [Paraburkholderia sediminicola]|uniref:terminase small subunit n=1 Tax=Paraburkholderia sediminicola TaxID=458836 RepID=UPI0038B84D6D
MHFYRVSFRDFERGSLNSNARSGSRRCGRFFFRNRIRAMPKLTANQLRFVDEYLIDLNATRAAEAAGYSKRTARQQGARLLTNVDIASAIQTAKQQRAERVEIEADAVLQEVYAIAMADTNGIVSFRRECCRYCWGVNHAYQFRSEGERSMARAAFQKRLAEARKAKVPRDMLPQFDDGGLGFRAKRDPHPECPQCDGDGHGRVFISDTRKLSPALRSLYGGVKHTKEGIEVKVHAKDRALELLMRHLGLLKEEVRVTVVDELAARLAAARQRRANGSQGGS